MAVGVGQDSMMTEMRPLCQFKSAAQPGRGARAGRRPEIRWLLGLRKVRLKVVFVAFLFACGLAHGQSQFETHYIEGWAVHLDKSIRAREPAVEAQVLQELQLRLREIGRLLPSNSLGGIYRRPSGPIPLCDAPLAYRLVESEQPG